MAGDGVWVLANIGPCWGCWSLLGGGEAFEVIWDLGEPCWVVWLGEYSLRTRNLQVSDKALNPGSLRDFTHTTRFRGGTEPDLVLN